MNKSEYQQGEYLPFWEILPDSKGRTTYDINKNDLQRFLTMKGFCKYYIDQSRFLIRIKENKIRMYTFEQIRDFITRFLRQAPDYVLQFKNKEGVLSTLYHNPTKYMSNSFLELLETRKIIEQSDTRDEANFFFKNCWVTVTKTGYKVMQYSDLNNPIWENQIINKNFEIVEPNKDFINFIINICNKDQKETKSLSSIIGYLLHGYKDPALTKAVIFCDETLGNLLEPKGRSGKSLLTKAIGQLKNTVTIDGKNFNFNNNFAFQNVDLSTQIINFNDVKKSFPFEQLFSVVTEGISIEKKYQQAFTIPYDKTPKIVISTNYSVVGSGDSFEARVIEFALSNHYSARHQPTNEFGKRFFDEWNEDEWNGFFIVLFECVQMYLDKGLIEVRSKNTLAKKIIQETSKEFYEFMKKVELGKRHSLKELYDKFNIENPGLLDHQRKFTIWLQKYSSYMGYKYETQKSNSNTYFTFSDYSQQKVIK